MLNAGDHLLGHPLASEKRIRVSNKRRKKSKAFRPVVPILKAYEIKSTKLTRGYYA